MPTLLDFRRRIRSVKNTQQITRAMKFISAAKLRRAQEGVFAARPYAGEILRVMRSAAVAGDEQGVDVASFFAAASETSAAPVSTEKVSSRCAFYLSGD